MQQGKASFVQERQGTLLRSGKLDRRLPAGEDVPSAAPPSEKRPQGMEIHKQSRQVSGQAGGSRVQPKPHRETRYRLVPPAASFGAVQASQGDPQTGNGRYRQNSSERTGRAGQASCPSRSQDSWDRKARWETTVKGILGPPGPPYSRGGSQAGTNSESSKSGPCNRQTGGTGGRSCAPRCDRGGESPW